MYIVYFLILIQIVILIGSILYSIKNKRDKLPLKIRILLSISFILSAIAAYFFSEYKYYSSYIILGAILSHFGDLAMAGLLKLKNRLIGGMSIFALAHFSYIAGFVLTVINKNLSITPVIYYCLLLFYFINVVSYLTNIRNLKHGKKLNIGAFIYGFIISTMASFALCLYVKVGGGFVFTALGSLLFIISDSIIAISVIGGKKINNRQIYIWLTYVLAQMCIVYGGIF